MRSNKGNRRSGTNGGGGSSVQVSSEYDIAHFSNDRNSR
jgi:hypothetical protein